MSQRRNDLAPPVPSRKTAQSGARQNVLGNQATWNRGGIWSGFQNSVRAAPLEAPTSVGVACPCQEEAAVSALPLAAPPQPCAARPSLVSPLSAQRLLSARGTTFPDPWRGFQSEEDVSGPTRSLKGNSRCGCSSGESKRPKSRTKDRLVSGDWLIEVLELDDDTASTVAGVQVRVTGEAWWALKAIQQAQQDWNRRQAEVMQARTTDWPKGDVVKKERKCRGSEGLRADAVKVAPPDIAASEGPCGCTTTLGYAARFAIKMARFVDSEEFVDGTTGGSDANDGMLRLHPDPLAPGGAWVLSINPWRSLRRAERWLNDDIYGRSGYTYLSDVCVKSAALFLRRGRTWDGSEEPDTSSGWSDAPVTPFDWSDPTGSRTAADYVTDLSAYNAVLLVNQFKGTRRGPLTIGAFGPAADGRAVLVGSSAEPQYEDDRVALQFVSCCNVHVKDIKFQGFGIGIDVRGGSKHHVYSNLEVCDQAIYGVRIGVRESDLDDFEASGELSATEVLVAADMFPRDMTILACNLYSNGYDTEGADVSLGYLAESCNILSNTLYGYDPSTGAGVAADGSPKRGIDGIVANGPSSGHLIDGNTIYLHNKGSYINDRQKTVLAATRLSVLSSAGAICSGSAVPPWVLLHGWEDDYETDTTTDCDVATDYGYAAYYLTDLTGDNESTTLIDAYGSTDADESIMEAFGEDGIDLKGVRNRTTDDVTMATVVRNNKIFGHDNHAGICVNDGSTNIHIYNNYLALNAVGILVTNSPNSGSWYENQDTSSIYIYRNVVYLNTGYGVQISSYIDESDVVYKVNGVYLVNNTIAHNYYNGVKIGIGYDETGADAAGHMADVDGIYMYNNLIARNGVGGSWKDAFCMQVVWDGLIDLSGTRGSTIVSNYNTYLGWNRKSDGTDEAVVLGYSSKDSTVVATSTDPYPSNYSTVKALQDAPTVWGIESNSLQSEDYGGLEVDEYELIFGSGLEEGRSDGSFILIDFWDRLVLPDLAVPGGIEVYSAAYAIQSGASAASSYVVDKGTSTSVNHYATGTDIATSPDIAGHADSGIPDVGALIQS